MKNITAPLRSETVRTLRAGDEVLLSGYIYTARDVAHKRLCDLIARGEELPLPLEGAVIYFTGPTPPRPGKIIGAAGPTTSYRMDPFSPLLIERAGIAGMIGKGNRGEAVVEAMQKNAAVYFAALGGGGALMAQSITAAEIVCYEDLGTEAIRRLTINNMPLIVAIDAEGKNLYKAGPAAYRR